MEGLTAASIVAAIWHCLRNLCPSVNVHAGPLEERLMTTGLHTVADIYCNCCGQNVGWKYEIAHEKSQKYKEGKFILERAKMIDGDVTNFAIDNNIGGSDADDV